ncbi:hypothetical protein G6L86_25370 [Agrobacterium tumefaciens]|uniref:hypothetical protein n=1 Tax=Agrobacterium tumefaciens TaxID=358 RepID=UPI001574C74F|nr:hypothetical protein [Agrobacterium tumefaciens]NSX88954.1 hypothetical protein [Agrobacterium tumefaciens]
MPPFAELFHGRRLLSQFLKPGTFSAPASQCGVGAEGKGDSILTRPLPVERGTIQSTMGSVVDQSVVQIHLPAKGPNGTARPQP